MLQRAVLGWLVGVMLGLASCGGDDGPAGREDAGPEVDGGTETDAAGRDAASDCPRDCDDGLFCNGVEVCAPDDPAADEDGCAPAPEPRDCDDGIACTTDACDDEAMACTHEAMDADGDSHADIGCVDADGMPLGDDCDDSDDTRHPGADELCNDVDEDCDPSTIGDTDVDRDTYVADTCCNPTASGPLCGSDCDDDVAGTHPSATETCNLVDDDCDGSTDEGDLLEPFWIDADGDGYGARGSTPMMSCPALRPPGYVDNDTDCDDTENAAHPGGTEVCDRLDNDCNGAVDDGSGLTTTAYRDLDGDGHGRAPLTVAGCTVPAGYVSTGGDCDDARAATYPGAADVCNGIDDDCSLPGGAAGGPDLGEDGDGDRHSSPLAACLTAPGAFPKDDCEDGVATIYAGAPEICDRIDQNCSLAGGPGGTDPAEDADADGYSPIGAACSGGFPATDCNDAAAAIRPGATEVCNRVDDNCSLPGAMAGGVDAAEDADSDMYAPLTAACTGGFPRTDCNDARTATYPGAPEVCNRIDDNCSLPGAAAGGVDVSEDGDGDMYAATAAACTGGFPRTDCDDARAATYPGAPEVCNGIDDDCGSGVDEPAEADAACGAMLACVLGRCTPVRGIAAGSNHACARLASGGVDCWGAGGQGQIGDGAMVTRPTASPASLAPADAIQVVAGESYSCALRRVGTVGCWGTNYDGRLGDGTTMFRTTPAAVSMVSTAIDVAAGYSHACAVLSSGGVRCWGTNAAGELGNGSTTPSLTAVAVTGITDAIQVAAGQNFSCARRGTGTVSCWGAGAAGQLGNGGTASSSTPVAVTGITDAVWLAAGYTHACAVRAGGAVRCWGQGSSGQLGDGAGVNRSTPVDVMAIADATRIAVASAHTCALRRTRAVTCWGGGMSGVLGDGSVGRNRLAPGASVSGLADAVDVAVASSSSCALRATGGAVCWGSDGTEQLGDGVAGPDARPVTVAGLDSVTAIDAGTAHTCARRASGDVRCWGLNQTAQLGDGTNLTSVVPVVAVGLNATTIGLGSNHSCAVRSGGGVSCWGNGFSVTPSDVAGLADVTQVEGGFDYTCVRRSGSTLTCWGNNSLGELGDGTYTYRPTPATSVVGISTGVQVDGAHAGGGHSCARLASGAVSCWGHNPWGALGNGTMTSTNTPVAVTGLADAVDVSAGYLHSCAARTGGSVWCWGYNGGYGQLGDGSMLNRSTPVTVVGVGGATDVDTGNSHSCARTSAGTVFCWGAGNLGNGTRDSSLTAVMVTGLTTAQQVAVGSNHACVLLSDGTVQCWGSNVFGQTGNPYGYTPVPVMGVP